MGKADEEIFRIASGFDLYLLASKIFMIILGKAYSDRKWTDLRLSKRKSLKSLVLKAVINISMRGLKRSLKLLSL
ncbi:MAG: hypothetical protein IPJ75_09570 [Ignavibacteriales bacterium]|nr:hypothetical protein [Ignavibacteriales bacterium]